MKIACDWSADGRFILYKQIESATGTWDLWALPMSGEGTPFQVVHTQYDERDGQFSPDGKWVAYQSDESGRPEIYLQPFPGPGPKVRVSINGGTQVRWRSNGKEILLHRARPTPDGGGHRPRRWRGWHRDAGAALHDAPRAYPVDLAATVRRGADGQRFLISSAEESPTSPITLILNWKGARSAAPDGVPR